eukprot:TRINITY_DN10138_c0_g1_i3.p1 TRINITY_DN10138_c0_g1~~TRINITY_DN10138_c0_g1_i3.p1  ORF type:complete len:896 (-),score=233.98 TRINITY_DN10138_c0_g1_i3:195-2882(-)
MMASPLVPRKEVAFTPSSSSSSPSSSTQHVHTDEKGYNSSSGSSAGSSKEEYSSTSSSSPHTAAASNTHTTTTTTNTTKERFMPRSSSSPIQRRVGDTIISPGNVRKSPSARTSPDRERRHPPIITTTRTAPTTVSPTASTASSSSDDDEDDEDTVHGYDPSQITILVVDDDSVARKVLQSFLTKMGFKVCLAVDGTAALEELTRHPHHYNMIITDVMMPMISGFTLVQTIRENEALKDVPIIMMSGSMIDNKSANDSIRIGGQDYLTKPIAKDLLKQKVDILLQNAYQKKRAQEYRNVLAREREKGTLLAKQMEAKQHEIEELKKRVQDMGTRDATIETPVQSIARTIEGLLAQKDWSHNPATIQSELQNVLRELASNSLFRPRFDKVLTSSSVDVVTKSFLVGQFDTEGAGEINVGDEEDSITAENEGVMMTDEESTSSSATSEVDNTTPVASAGAIRAARKFPPHHNKYTKEGLQKWEFDVFKYSEDELLPMIMDIFEHFDLFNQFKIPQESMQMFLLEARTVYRVENRYHNFIHAFDVLHAVQSFLTEMGCAKYFPPLDLLSLLFAALCHDLDHPGSNNNFQINTQSDLALMYNDVSVLENHHASLAFRIAQRTGLFQGLTTDQYKEMRKFAVQLILATDMTNHFEYVSKFTYHLDNQEFDPLKKEDRQLIGCFLLKCADVSNSAKPWKLSHDWSARIADEFFNQSAYEREHGLPVAPFMDKTKTSMPRITADFIDYVAKPLFKVLCRFLGNEKFDDMILINRRMWGDLLAVQQAAKEAEERKSTTPASSVSPSLRALSSSPSLTSSSSSSSPSLTSSSSSSSSLRPTPASTPLMGTSSASASPSTPARNGAATPARPQQQQPAALPAMEKLDLSSNNGNSSSSGGSGNSN